MYSKLVLTGGLVAAAVVLAACSTTGSYAVAPNATSTAPPSVAPVVAPPSSVPSAPAYGIMIGTASTRLGTILVDSSGRTVYLFVADSGTTSSCNSASCVQYWPPVLTTGAPQAGSGVNASLLGTTTRADGAVEVTYAGHPLYYFVSDKKAGDVSGQAINAFGAPWYVVSPSGTRIG